MPKRMSVKLFLFVGAGGMLGTGGRYCISLLFGDTDGYPFATLTVNLIGCFLLPFLLNHPNVKQKLAPELLTALTVGLIGSFTTFSTLAVETARLWNESVAMAIGYIMISFLIGLALCFLGYRISTRKQVNE